MPRKDINLIPFIFASLIVCGSVGPAKGGSVEKAKMRLIDVFDGGQPGVNIYKLFDSSEGVACYVLTPEIAARKMQEGAWVYDGNSAGSISCVYLLDNDKNKKNSTPLRKEKLSKY